MPKPHLNFAHHLPIKGGIYLIYSICQENMSCHVAEVHPWVLISTYLLEQWFSTGVLQACAKYSLRL
jgi:hypothetical protein